MEVVVIFLSISLFSLLSFYAYRKKKQVSLKNGGLKGPGNNWLFGCLHLFKKTPVHQLLLEWGEKYGETFGYYEGGIPIVVTADLDLLKDAFITNFSSWNARKEFPIQPDPEGVDGMHMLHARSSRWKRLRSIISPTFSKVKLRKMSGTVEECISTMINCLDKEKKDLHSSFQALTFDIIGRTAFGMKVQAQTNPNDPFLKRAKQIFALADSPPLYILLPAIVPEIKRSFFKLFTFVLKYVDEPSRWLLDRLGEVIQQRRNEGITSKEHPDLLQLMLDAEKEEPRRRLTMRMDSISEFGSDSDSPVQTPTPTPTPTFGRQFSFDEINVQKKLTEEEVKNQSFLFLLAGYETTSTVLIFTAYELAKNKQVQEELQKEIDKVPGPFNANVIDTMPYLDKVVREILRMYPVASPQVNRLCLADTKLGPYSLKKGTILQANVWKIHYDERHWGSNPHVFDPSRHTKENRLNRNNLAFLAFGGGPRNCVGLRFALMEVKLALISMLKKYSIVMTEKTPDKIPLKEGAVIAPKQPLYLEVIER